MTTYPLEYLDNDATLDDTLTLDQTAKMIPVRMDALSAVNPDIQVVDQAEMSAISNVVRAMYTIESFGIDLAGVHINADGRVMGKSNSGETIEIADAFRELQECGLNPLVTIYNETNFPAEMRSLALNPNNSRYALLTDSKNTIRGQKSTPLGLVQFDYEEADNPIPSYVSYQLFENQRGVSDTSEKLFHAINNTLQAIGIDQLDSVFRRVLNNSVDTTTLNYEKVAILDQLITLLGETEGFELSTNDREFLEAYELSILKGEYDDVFRNAIKDTMVSIALTQVVATVGSPALGIILGHLVNPPTGVAVAGATYAGAPIPSWMYMQYRHWQFNKSFDNWRRIGGSFLAMNVPIIGGGAAYPLSIDYQTRGELGRFKRLVRTHPELAEEMTTKEKVVDFLLYGAAKKGVVEEVEAEDSDWKIIDRITFDGGNEGIEIVHPKSSEAKQELARFVAAQHIKHGLSLPTDANIRNVGSKAYPIYELIDSSDCDYDWIVVRDGDSKGFVVAAKMYHKKDGCELPMQRELTTRKENDTLNGKNPIKSDLNIDQVVEDFDYEVGSLAFNMDNLAKGQNKREKYYRYTLALLSWLRGINAYMEEKGVGEFGAVFTRKAFNYLSKMGELGMESITDPFFYLPYDESTQTESEIIRLNHNRAKSKMLSDNPSVHQFVVQGMTNNQDVRRAIWGDIIKETYKPDLKKGIINYTGNLLTRAFLLARLGSTVAFKV